MIWLKRLWAWLTGAQVVWLLDYDGEVVSRIARPNVFGLSAWRYGLGVKRVLLHEGGKVTGASYVVEWRPDEYPKCQVKP